MCDLGKILKVWTKKSIVAWRGWDRTNNTEQDGTLRSWFFSDIWHKKMKTDPPSHYGEAGGFYALKNKNTVITELMPDYYGRVRLYGKIVEHEHGYRAEKAEILSVTCNRNELDKKELTAIRKRYNLKRRK